MLRLNQSIERDRRTGGQTDREADRQTGGRTDRQAEKHAPTYIAELASKT